MYHIIVNAAKRDKQYEEKISEVSAVFERAGAQYKIYETERRGHATELARGISSQEEGAEIIAMGGDGTLHEVLNGICDTAKCTLGLIPLGTGNDFAECAHIPTDARAAAEIIAFRAPTKIDYIELAGGLRSINAVGTGIDVDVLKRAYKGKKKGKGKYFSAFIKSLFCFKANRYKIVYDGKEEEHTGIICCLGNGRQIGGGIKLFPEADIRDGYIDLITVDYLTKFRTLIAFAKLNAGKVNKVKEVTHVRCKSAHIIPLDGAATIQAEGELYDGVELDAHIEEGKLSFYLPESDD